MRGIPEHECPIIRPRRILPVLGPYPSDFVLARGSSDSFFLDATLREVQLQERGPGGDPVARVWLLEPATTATCSHGHRHVLALKFIG